MIREATQWHCHKNVENGESQTHQQTYLCIAQRKIGLNGSDHQCEDLAIEKGHQVRKGEYAHDVPMVGSGFMRRLQFSHRVDVDPCRQNAPDFIAITGSGA